MVNADQCGGTYDDRDRGQDRSPGDREHGIDPQVVRSASDACNRQYNGARPTPLFNERGRPVCCGPVKNYDRYDGRVVESCPPSRGSDRDDGGRYDDRHSNDDMGAQNARGGDGGGGGGGQQRMN